MVSLVLNLGQRLLTSNRWKHTNFALTSCRYNSAIYDTAQFISVPYDEHQCVQTCDLRLHARGRPGTGYPDWHNKTRCCATHALGMERTVAQWSILSSVPCCQTRRRCVSAHDVSPVVHLGPTCRIVSSRFLARTPLLVLCLWSKTRCNMHVAASSGLIGEHYLSTRGRPMWRCSVAFTSVSGRRVCLLANQFFFWLYSAPCAMFFCLFSCHSLLQCSLRARTRSYALVKNAWNTCKSSVASLGSCLQHSCFLETLHVVRRMSACDGPM